MVELQDVMGEKSVVVWFGRFGNTKSCIEKKGFNVRPFEFSLVVNEASVIRAAEEIRAGLKYDSWDKYYVCKDLTIAKKLLAAVPTAERWNNYIEE